MLLIIAYMFLFFQTNYLLQEFKLSCYFVILQ